MLGDSVTFGYGISEEKIFPALLKLELSKEQKIEILNFGIAGNDTYGNFYLLKKAILKFSPDLIVYQFGLNDIPKVHLKSHFDKNSNKKPEVRKNTMNEHFLSRSVLYLFLAERYNYLKLTFGKNHWSFQEWNFSEDQMKQELNHFKEIYHFLNQKHVPMLFVFFPYAFQVYSPHPMATRVQTIFKDFWETHHWPYLDMTPVFKQQKKPYDLFLDDAHLSHAGHKVTAHTLLPHLKPLLGPKTLP